MVKIILSLPRQNINDDQLERDFERGGGVFIIGLISIQNHTLSTLF